MFKGVQYCCRAEYRIRACVSWCFDEEWMSVFSALVLMNFTFERLVKRQLRNVTGNLRMLLANGVGSGTR